jgi:hypothetical protein
LRPASCRRCAPAERKPCSVGGSADNGSSRAVRGHNRERFLAALLGSVDWLAGDGQGDCTHVARRNAITRVVFWSRGTERLFA